MSVLLSILIILVSIGLIFVVLMQEGNKQGLGAIGGGAETFFGKNKAKSYEGKLALITKILIVVFIAIALIMTVIVASENKEEQAEYDAMMLEQIEAQTAEMDAAQSTATEETETETVETESTETESTETEVEPAVEETTESAEAESEGEE